MSTFMANKGNIERKWYVIDAAGKPMGKTAVAAADLLRGKRKVTYTPHADCGDNVIIINASKAILTGNKMEQKYYRTHSGWVGGLGAFGGFVFPIILAAVVTAYGNAGYGLGFLVFTLFAIANIVLNWLGMMRKAN